MKNKLLLQLLVLVMIMIVSCKKETTDPSPNPTYQNGFTIYGLFRETNQAVYFNKDGFVGFAFFSSSLHLDTANAEWHGTGNGMDFEEIFTTMTSGIPIGTYTLDTTGAIGTFTDSFMILNYDFDADTGIDSYGISGTVNISKVNDDYLFQYNLIMYDSAIITGTYFGKPTDISSMIEGKHSGILKCNRLFTED
jgi:hypothetical protein